MVVVINVVRVYERCFFIEPAPRSATCSRLSKSWKLFRIVRRFC